MDMDKLIARLTGKEGSRQFAYDDSTGKPLRQGAFLRGNLTIGRGRNLTAKGISDEEALYLERNDITEAYTACRQQPWWPVICADDVRSRAMVEVVFNMGMGGLHGFPNMRAALQAGDWAKAADDYLDSDVEQEIGQRARDIASMLRTGQDIS